MRMVSFSAWRQRRSQIRVSERARPRAASARDHAAVQILTLHVVNRHVRVQSLDERSQYVLVCCAHHKAEIDAIEGNRDGMPRGENPDFLFMSPRRQFLAEDFPGL